MLGAVIGIWLYAISFHSYENLVFIFATLVLRWENKAQSGC